MTLDTGRQLRYEPDQEGGRLMVELKDIGDPGPQCGVCLHYQEVESKVVGYHKCRSYPKIMADIVAGTYPCQVGPVRASRRLTAPPAGAPPAPPAEQEPEEAQGYHKRVAAEQEQDGGRRRPGRPRKTAGK